MKRSWSEMEKDWLVHEAPNSDDEHSDDPDGREHDYGDEPSDYSDGDSSYSDWSDNYASDGDDDDEEEEDDDAPICPVAMECAVCCHWGVAFVSASDPQQAPLGLPSLVDAEYKFLMRPHSFDMFRDDLLVCGPCERRDHVVCVTCLRKMMTDRASLPAALRAGGGYYPCPYPHGPACTNALNQRNVFSGCMSFLLSAADARAYHTLAESIRVAASTPADAYNHYLAPEGPRPYPGMLRHEEVDVRRARQEYARLCEADSADVQCKVCGVYLRRGTECNALSHCGVEVCGCCGRSDVFLGNDQDHWKVCPRYDDHHEPFKALGYLCEQGKCYTDTTECRDPSHAPGRRRVREYKIRRQRESLLQSLDPEMQKQVVCK